MQLIFYRLAACTLPCTCLLLITEIVCTVTENSSITKFIIMKKRFKTLKFRSYAAFREWYIYITAKYTHLTARVLSNFSSISAVVVVIMY